MLKKSIDELMKNHQNWSLQGVDAATLIEVSCTLHVRGQAVCTVCKTKKQDI